MKLIILLLLSINVFSQRTGILFQSLSEGTSLDNWNQVERCQPTRIGLYSFVKRYGTQSTRFTSRLLDSSFCTVRSQVIMTDTLFTSGDRWYGMSVYFGTGYPSNYEGYDNFFEFYNKNTEENPPFFLSYHGQVNGMGKYPTGDYLTITRYTPSQIKIYPLWPITKNSWVDIVMKVKWRRDTTGTMTIWVNGRKAFNYKGITQYSPTVMRLGNNFWNWSKRLIDKGLPSSQMTKDFYMDEFRIGNASSEYIDVYPDNNDIAPPANSFNQFYSVQGNAIQVQKIVFSVQQDTAYQANWVLKNSQGRRMMSGSLPLNKGYKTYTINLPFTISSGSYTFLLETNNFMHIHKLQKQ